MLDVADPVRAQLRRAVYGSLALAALFTLTTGPVKQYRPLFNHAPWLNDPFDTVISFMMFFVPFAAACCVARVPLCRRYEPLPAVRARDLLRGCQVILAGVALTLSSEWVAVAIGANRAAWSGATIAQVAVLAALSVATVLAARAVARHGLRALAGLAPQREEPDWLGDVVALALLRSGWFGPMRSLIARAVSWCDRRVVTVVRRHPLWCAAALWGAFALAIGVRQSLNEGYSLGAASLLVVLLGGGMLGLSVLAGGYLGIVHSVRHLSGPRRRAVDALVATCVGVLVPFALRYHLWWVVGSTNAVAGLSQLVGLLGVSAFIIFGTTFGAETALGRHTRPGT